VGYRLYNTLLALGTVLLFPVLPILLLSGKRFREGFWDRLACYSRATRGAARGGKPIWIHAVSVGEVLAARPIAARLKALRPDRKILVSTFTSTGNAVARENLAADTIIYLPLDYPWVVRRALKLFDPSLLIIVETEIWPNLLRAAAERKTPVLLLSGRLSRRSFHRYYLLRRFFAAVLRQFAALGMQSREDAERIVRLGADPRKVSVTGNLKRSSAPADENTARGERRDLSGLRGESGRVLVAGSTHRGEEEILLNAFVSLKQSFPELVMVLAPRHPQRFAEVEKLIEKRGLRYARRSRLNGRLGQPPDVVLLDTIGELADFYRVADVAFVGGSLVDAGGHNLLEPAWHRKPVLFGPWVGGYAEIAAEMKQSGGGIQVRGEEEFILETSRLLSDRERARAAGENAFQAVQAAGAVVDQSMELISRYL
jgi:3-deoxy-D-manno-octulosonic-acid transferase